MTPTRLILLCAVATASLFVAVQPIEAKSCGGPYQKKCKSGDGGTGTGNSSGDPFKPGGNGGGEGQGGTGTGASSGDPFKPGGNGSGGEGQGGTGTGNSSGGPFKPGGNGSGG